MNAQHAGGARFPSCSARKHRLSPLLQIWHRGLEENREVRDVRATSPRAYVTPQMCFFRRDDPHTHSALLLGGGRSTADKEHCLSDGSVVAVQSIPAQRPRERAHFVEQPALRGREERVKSRPGSRAQFLEYSESERLSDGDSMPSKDAYARRIPSIHRCQE